MLLAIVVVVAVGGFAALTFSTVLAVTSARSLQRAVAGVRAQILPQVTDVGATARGLAERAKRLRLPGRDR